MCLVHNEQTDTICNFHQYALAKVFVGEPFGRYQQGVDLIVKHVRDDVVPVSAIGRSRSMQRVSRAVALPQPDFASGQAAAIR